MYDIKWIREHPEAFDRGLDAARAGAVVRQADLLLDERRARRRSPNSSRRRRAAMSASKEIGEAKKKKDEAAAQKLMAEVNELKVTLPALEAEQKKLGDELDKELAQIPNTPADDVPDGTDAHRQCRASLVRQEARLRLQAQAAFRTGRSARHDGFRDWRRNYPARALSCCRKAWRGMERALGQLFLDVHTEREAWLYGGQSAAAGARRGDVRDGAIAEICR